MTADFVVGGFLEDPREEWLEWRSKGIGASDVAGIVGLSPWASPYSVWSNKVGLSTVDESEAMEFGRRAEPMIAPWFTEQTGLDVAGEQTWCSNPAEPWMRCTVDGFILDDGERAGILEIKTTSRSAEEWADGVPDHYACQGQWAMAVTGLPICWFAVLHLAFGRPQLRHYVLDADADDQKFLIDACRAFWFEHCLKVIPPAVDTIPATWEALKRVPEDGGEVNLDADAVAIRWEWLQAKAKLTTAKAEVEYHAAQLRSILAGNSVGLIDGRKAVTWKTQLRHDVDIEALKADHPDLVEKYVTATPVRVLRPARLKGE